MTSLMSQTISKNFLHKINIQSVCVFFLFRFLSKTNSKGTATMNGYRPPRYCDTSIKTMKPGWSRRIRVFALDEMRLLRLSGFDLQKNQTFFEFKFFGLVQHLLKSVTFKDLSQISLYLDFFKIFDYFIQFFTKIFILCLNFAINWNFY